MFGSLRIGYITLLALAAIFVAIGLSVGDRPALSYIDLVSARTLLLTYVLPPVLWLSWLGIQVTIRKVDRPTAAIMRLVKHRRNWLLRGSLLTVLCIPAARAFSTIKQSISDFVPFYADPAFAQADRLLFFGLDPWRITHAVFGPVSTLVLDRLYILWLPLTMGLVAWYSFTHDQRLQLRGMLTFFLSWLLLGNVLAIATASVGPCFYELYYGDAHFRPMMDTLREYDAMYGIKAFTAMDWLYETRDQEHFAAGISAMPSLHVGIAFLMFLTVRRAVRLRWPAWCAGTYAFAIWVGSVHLGWHYAVDGLVSIFGVSLIWWASGRFVAWVDRRGQLMLVPHSGPGAVVDVSAAA